MSTHRRLRTGLVTGTLTLILLNLTLLAPAHARGLTASHAATGRPIYIGQILPLTGDEAYALGPGVAEKNGVQLALRQINEHGGIKGRPLKVVLVDSQSTDGGTIVAFKRLAKSGRFAAILGPNRSKELMAMMPFVRRASIPVMAGGGSESMTHQGNRWVFRIQPSPVYGNRALATFTVSTLHLTKIALIHPDDPANQESAVSLRGDLKTLGVTPVTDQSFTTGTSDLTAQVLAIKKSGATALLPSASFPSDYLLLANRMRDAGVHLTWLGTSVMTTPQVLRAPTLFSGTYAATPYAPGQSTEAAAFDHASRARFHLGGNFTSAYGYDALQILARVMRKVGTHPQAIRRGILAIRGYRGALGTYNFDKHGDGLRQYTIVQNVHGILHVIKVLSF